MQVQSINSPHNPNFGNNIKKNFTFKLSRETINAIESSTRLTYEEITHLSQDECLKLMKERGALKEPSKLKMWFAKKYKEFGERYGLLEKHYNFYTDID